MPNLPQKLEELLISTVCEKTSDHWSDAAVRSRQIFGEFITNAGFVRNSDLLNYTKFAKYHFRFKRL